MSIYSEEFTLAIDRTIRFELKLPAIQTTPAHRWLTPNAINEFAQVLLSEFSNPSVEDLSKKCLSVHKRMASVIHKWLGCEVMYTLGWIDGIIAGGLYSGFNDEFINNRINLGHKDDEINIHAWLTLPSMEIIDITLLTTIGDLKNRPSWLGNFILRHADEITDMVYKPMLVGDDFFTKADIRIV